MKQSAAISRTRPVESSAQGRPSLRDDDTLMRHVAFVFAVASIVCVLAVFFFPAVQGPYSAVHGPVTVMHAARAAAGVRLAVVRAGLTAYRSHGSAALAVLHWTIGPNVDPRPGIVLSVFRTPLRC
jgi:hypothetical protein